jgi:transcription-repair coupling factor (superfamily II helicase)
MRDLEIRGCGNILGGEQSGSIATVGYDTYCQLIREAVAEIRGEPLVERVLPPFEIAVDAYIPDDYVPSEGQKMILYRRIAMILTVEGAREMLDELRDRFGRPPQPVERLVDVMRIRARGADVNARSITGTKDKVTIEFASSQTFNRRMANELKAAFGASVSFGWQDYPSVILALPPGSNPLVATEKLLKAIADI